jgi:hypothetical protein
MSLIRLQYFICPLVPDNGERNSNLGEAKRIAAPMEGYLLLQLNNCPKNTIDYQCHFWNI